MEHRYTTAFIGITHSGELYIIRQYQGISLLDCLRWRSLNREELTKLYGGIREVTIQHKNK